MYTYTNTLPNSLLCRRAHFVLPSLQIPLPLWYWKIIQKKNSLIFFPAQSNRCTVLLDRIHILVHLLSQDSKNLFLTTPSEQGSREISLCLKPHSNFKFPLSSQGTDDLKFYVFSLLLLDPACSIQWESFSFCFTLLLYYYWTYTLLPYLAVSEYRVQSDFMLHTTDHLYLSQHEMKVLSIQYSANQVSDILQLLW